MSQIHNDIPPSLPAGDPPREEHSTGQTSLRPVMNISCKSQVTTDAESNHMGEIGTNSINLSIGVSANLANESFPVANSTTSGHSFSQFFKRLSLRKSASKYDTDLNLRQNKYDIISWVRRKLGRSNTVCITDHKRSTKQSHQTRDFCRPTSINISPVNHTPHGWTKRIDDSSQFESEIPSEQSVHENNFAKLINSNNDEKACEKTLIGVSKRSPNHRPRMGWIRRTFTLGRFSKKNETTTSIVAETAQKSSELMELDKSTPKAMCHSFSDERSEK